MNNKSAGVGCAAIIGIVFLLAVAAWAINILLWILGFALPVLGISVGVYFFRQALNAGSAKAEYEEVFVELDNMVNDASFDLSNTITRFDQVVATKGIGTPLESNPREIQEIQRQLFAAHEALKIAGTPAHKAEAINTADRIRAKAERYL